MFFKQIWTLYKLLFCIQNGISLFFLINTYSNKISEYVYIFTVLYIYCLVFHKSTVMEASHSCVSRYAIIISSREGSNIPKNRDEEGDIVFFPQAQGYAGEDELRSIHLTVRREFCSGCVHGISRGRIERDQRGG